MQERTQEARGSSALALRYEVFHMIGPSVLDTGNHVQAKTLATHRDRAELGLKQRGNRQLVAKQLTPTPRSTTCLKVWTLRSKPSFMTPTSGPFSAR